MSGAKIGTLFVVGQEPGTTKFWFKAEKAKFRVPAVKNGRALGSFLLFLTNSRKNPFCSPSWPITKEEVSLKVATNGKVVLVT